MAGGLILVCVGTRAEATQSTFQLGSKLSNLAIVGGLVRFCLGAGRRVAVPQVNLNASASPFEHFFIGISTRFAPELVPRPDVRQCQSNTSAFSLAANEQIRIVRTGDEIMAERMGVVVCNRQGS